MKSSLVFLLISLLFLLSNCDSTEQGSVENKNSPFEQTIEGSIIVDYENIEWDSRETTIEDFLSLYGEHIHNAKSLSLHGLTNKMADTFMKSVSESISSETCKLTSLVMKGIRDEECPSMKREQRKRPCKMSREATLREIASLFSKCPLEVLSVEGNQFSATAVIDLAKRASEMKFPHLKLLDIDDNNYNYDNIAMPRMVRIIREMPPQIEVRSFFAETLLVIQHNKNTDTPFRYNFDQRYPSDCRFYSEPIKDEEFELLIKYQPCVYANSLLAHGTGRGEPWVRYMTAMFSQNVYENIRAMEIFGNDLYKGNMDEFLPLFTAERFPKLDSIDMSSNGLKSIRITADLFPFVTKLSLDTNGLTSFVVEDNALQNVESLKLGYNLISEFHIGDQALTQLKKLYMDNNQLSTEVAKSIINAPFAKSLTIFSLFNNPTIGDNAEEFVDAFIKAVENKQFENLKMLYLGQCGLKPYCKRIEEVVRKNISTIKHVTCF